MKLRNVVGETVEIAGVTFPPDVVVEVPDDFEGFEEALEVCEVVDEPSAVPLKSDGQCYPPAHEPTDPQTDG